MASAVEGPSGHGQPAVRPPVAIAGVDASGNVRHLLLTSTGALSLAASSVSIGEVQLLGADGLTLGVVTGTGALKVDGSAVTQPVSLAAETTKVIGTVNIAAAQTVGLAAGAQVIGSISNTAFTANAGTNLNTSALALDATLTGGTQQVQGNVASGVADSGNPVKVGGKYVAAGINLTDGKRADLQLSSAGMLLTTIASAGGSSVAVGSSQSADALASNFTTFAVLPFNVAYNGTTWDRVRTATIGDTAAATGITATQGYVYNGTTYDRQYGDKTNGAYVNVKAGAQFDVLNETLRQLVVESRIQTFLLGQGLNVQDDPDLLRNEPSYTP